MIYVPWKNNFKPLDDESTLQCFQAYFDSNTLPQKVLLQIRRARDQHLSRALWKEPTSDSRTIDYNTFSQSSALYDNNDDAVNLASTLPVTDTLEEDPFDYGKHYKWHIPSYPVPKTLDANIDTWLETMVNEHRQDKTVHTSTNIPKKHDGSEFRLQDATDDQAQVLTYILDHLYKWFDETQLHKPEPLRVIISGVAGSGKSTLTNTIVTAIRKIFGKTKAVKVVAPTGQAAFNAGGTTCHHGLGVSIDKGMEEGISPAKLKQLLQGNADLVLLVFDERSLVSSKLLARCHYNMCQSAYGGTNSDKSWGNIPIVLFVGDDYQLPSVESGCLSVFDNTSNLTDEEHYGNRIFLELARKVVSLKESKRQHGTQTRFMRILRGLRCENPQVCGAHFFFSKNMNV
jgi:hypothetical protein